VLERFLIISGAFVSDDRLEPLEVALLDALGLLGEQSLGPVYPSGADGGGARRSRSSGGIVPVVSDSFRSS
jgi:hypothetical protein